MTSVMKITAPLMRSRPRLRGKPKRFMCLLCGHSYSPFCPLVRPSRLGSGRVRTGRRSEGSGLGLGEGGRGGQRPALGTPRPDSSTIAGEVPPPRP